MKWFQGRKEILIETVAGVSLVLSSAGVAPKAVVVLDAVAAAARAGDTRTALTGFALGIVALARAAYRARINRRDRRDVELDAAKRAGR